MVAYLECRFAEVLADFFSAAREFQTNPSASPAKMADLAGKLRCVVAEFLVAGAQPQVGGLSPEESALYRVALRYGSATGQHKRAVLRSLVDQARGLAPLAAARPS